MSLCPKCSAEIPEGELTCPVCHTEIQLVPDYETLNFDLLEKEQQKNADNEEEKLREEALRAEQEKIFRRNRLIKIIVIAAVIAALGITAYFVWNYWQNNANKETVITFDDYYQRALLAYNSKDYDNANGILNEALKLEPGNVDALVLKAMITSEIGNKYEAITEFQTIIENNPEAVNAYRELIKIYLADNDTDSINALLESSPESIKTALSDYIAGAPIFSLEAGTYVEEQDVTISSTGVRIYYTTDGSTPGNTSALYSEPIHLAEGTTILKAVSETSAGVLSSVAEATYIIDRNAPAAPVVTPGSGTYYGADNMITVSIPIGCKCYYSFDSKPAEGVNEYTGPVTMQEGDHIFYAMLVNEYGVSGAVAAATFIYYAEAPQEEYTPTEAPTYYYPPAAPAATDAPAVTDTPTPTSSPTSDPISNPTQEPTQQPTQEPTQEPTPDPSELLNQSLAEPSGE